MRNLTLIIVVSFLLFLLGFLGLSFLTGFGLLEYWKQKMQIIVELRDDIQEKDLGTLQIQLETAEYVNPNSINIITKDEAAGMMKQDFGDEFLTLDIENPLRNVYTFNVKPDFNDASKLEQIKSDLLKNAAVADVFYEKNMSQGIVKNLSKFLWSALGLAVLFVFIAVFIIRQHIVLTWTNEKVNIFLAENSEEALAELKKSHFWRSIKNGLWSGAIAVTALMIYNLWFTQNFSELTSFIDNIFVIALFVFILIISVLCYTSTTYFLQKKQIIDTY
jgi:cell division transport system permease protein